jgi:hypothetical protein
MTFLLPIGLLALLVLAVLRNRRQSADRRQTVEQLAAAHGFGFAATTDVEALRATYQLPLFQHGQSAALNVLTGRTGDQALVLLEFLYQTGSGRSSRITAQTVALFQGAAPHLPDMTVGPALEPYLLSPLPRPRSRRGGHPRGAGTEGRAPAG